MLARAEDSVLIVVDMQPTFLAPIHERDRVMARTKFLEQAAKILGVPVLATEQYPERMGGTDPEVLSSLASRLARLSKQCGPEEHARVVDASGGPQLPDLCRAIVDGLDPDRQIAEARRTFDVPGDEEPTENRTGPRTAEGHRAVADRDLGRAQHADANGRGGRCLRCHDRPRLAAVQAVREPCGRIQSRMSRTFVSSWPASTRDWATTMCFCQ